MKIKTTIKFISSILTTLMVIVSCNKTKINTSRLDDAEWSVTSLSVDGTNESKLPTWKLSDCDAYKASCKGIWRNTEGGQAEFIWQFRSSGKTFEISNQAKLIEEEATDEAIMQCEAFSGVYTVIENGKKKMKFETTSALGYVGKKVTITAEKK
jgi:hypothetical protein